MPRLDLNRETLPEFLARADALTEQSKRHFGKLSLPDMLSHLRGALEMSLGEREAQLEPFPLPRTLAYFLFFVMFTKWPGGKIKAPDSFTPPAESDFETERAALRDKMEAFAAALEAHPEQTAVHGLFGEIPLRRWARVHGVHMNHHLRQFGV